MAQASLKVALIGAGHAHLYVVAHARALIDCGAEVILIDPHDFWYSGSATAMLGGAIEPSQDRIDLDTLAKRFGVARVADRVVGIDPCRRELQLGGGTRITYDLASCNVGSEIDTDAIRITTDGAWPVKPIMSLVALRTRMERACTAGQRQHVVVIGGGASGCEVAASIDALARRRDARAKLDLTIVTSGPRLLEQHTRRASGLVHSVLSARNIMIRTSARATEISPGEVRIADGSRLLCGTAVIATGLKPPELLAALPSGYRDGRALRVDATLRCSADPRLFGAGDCIRFGPRPLRPVGVYAVRQAPVLLANLVASLRRQPLREFRPQQRTLLILNLGDERGLALWGPCSWYGRTSLRIKNRIDRAFLLRYS